MKVLPFGSALRDRTGAGQHGGPDPGLDALLAGWKQQRLGSRRQEIHLSNSLQRLALLRRRMAWNRRRLHASRLRLHRAVAAL